MSPSNTLTHQTHYLSPTPPFIITDTTIYYNGHHYSINTATIYNPETPVVFQQTPSNRQSLHLLPSPDKCTTILRLLTGRVTRNYLQSHYLDIIIAIIITIIIAILIILIVLDNNIVPPNQDPHVIRAHAKKSFKISVL